MVSLFENINTENKLTELMRKINGDNANYLNGLLLNLKNHFEEAYEHSKYTAQWASAIAEQCGFSYEDVNKVYLSGLLHDVGKVKIPYHILSKPDKLTEEEFAIIREHPNEGYLLIKDYVPGDIAFIVLMHHERLDGSGYPFRLKKGSIPEFAKILMIADSFDAMIVHRVYNRKRSYADALLELRKENCKYDMKYVDALERVLIEKRGLNELKSG